MAGCLTLVQVYLVGGILFAIVAVSYDFVVSYYAISLNFWSFGICWPLYFLIGMVLRKIMPGKTDVVTQTGIILTNRKIEIPFDEMKQIDNGTLVLVKEDTPKKVVLPDCELMKLVRTPMNDWFIDYESFTIFQGTPGESLHIRFAPIGRYVLFSSVKKLILPAAIFGVPIYAILNEWIALPFKDVSMLFLLILGLFLLVRKYKKVTVTLNDTGVTLTDEGGQERFLAFSEVEKVDKGFFQIKVTAKDGEVFRYPRACYLLPELFEELARGAKG